MKLHVLHESQYKSAVAIVYDEHANILLGKATNDDDRKGKWCFPGGKITPGETTKEAASRECLEETGFVVDPQQTAFPYNNKPSVGFVVCRKLNGSMQPNNEFSELQWVPWNKVLELKNLYPDVAEILRKPIASFP